MAKLLGPARKIIAGGVVGQNQERDWVDRLDRPT